MGRGPSVESLAAKFTDAASRLRAAVTASEFRRHVNAVLGTVPKSPRGAELRLTAEVQEEVCDLIRMGCTWEEAAAGVGLDDKTLLRWQSLGRRASGGIYRDFFDAVAQARKGKKPWWLQQLLRAGKTDPATLRWLGERVLREELRPPRVDVEVNQELERFVGRLKRKLPPEVFELVLVAATEDDEPESRDADGLPSVAVEPEKVET
jgi:hypothetical protein